MNEKGSIIAEIGDSAIYKGESAVSFSGIFSEIRHLLESACQRRCVNKERSRQHRRWCYLIKTLRILLISRWQNQCSKSFGFFDPLLAERHKRGRLRHHREGGREFKLNISFLF